MEYITANGTTYECQSVTTSTNSISFVLGDGNISEIAETFKEVTDLTVSNDSNETYGTYTNIVFESATVFEDGSITVTMHIPSATELKLSSLEASQLEQDNMIAELMFGGAE